MEKRFIVSDLNRLNLLHRICVSKIASQYGLYPGQFPILHYVYHNPKCTQKDISNSLQISPPSIAMSIKRMKKDGLIIKLRDENDLRINHIELTDKAKEKVELLINSFNKYDDKMFKDIDEKERESFYNCLNKMIDNLSEDKFKDKTNLYLLEEIKKSANMFLKIECKNGEIKETYLDNCDNKINNMED